MSYKISRYGWLPDLPDHRDHYYAAPVEKAAVLPVSTDLRDQCPPVYDQGQLGSCTANAIAGAIEFDRLKQKVGDFTPSRLFIYYNERVIEHTVDSDSGAQIRDGIKSVAKQGDCPETEWPYVIAKFKTKPAARCYADALQYRVVLYQRLVPVLSQLKGCLASGYPFVFGFTVYESFESPQWPGPATLHCRVPPNAPSADTPSSALAIRMYTNGLSSGIPGEKGGGRRAILHYRMLI